MEEIKVDQFEYQKTRAPNELYSGGVGPCIVVGAIYRKKGYMFHQHSVASYFSSKIEPIFRDLKKDVKDKSKLQLYIVGGKIYKEYKEEMIEGRKIVLDKIAENGFEECVKEIRWCPFEYYQTLRLILDDGRAEIEENPD